MKMSKINLCELPAKLFNNSVPNPGERRVILDLTLNDVT